MNVEIDIAQTAKYNPYYNRHTHKIEYFVVRLVDKIAEFFPNLPNDVTVRIRPIKSSGGSYVAGYSIGRYTLEIDCRQSNLWKLADTIAHEFCHMEQKALGKLDFDYSGSKTMRRWVDDNGEIKLFPTKDKSHEEYLALPWEVDAREKAAAFVEKHTFFIHELTLDVMGVKSYEERKRKR